MYKFRVFLIFFILQHGFGKALPKFKSYRMARNTATPNVDELNSPLEIQNVADNSDDEIRAFFSYPNTEAHGSSNEQIKSSQATSDDSPPTKRHRWHLGCHSENTEKNTRSLENFDGPEDNIVLEVRQPQGQPQQPQPMTTQQQQMPMQPPPLQNPQMPQMQGPNPQMQVPNPQMQVPNPQMQMQNPQMQPQPGTMQPMVGGSMQMHPPDGQFHGQMPTTGTMAQPGVGYPTQPGVGYPMQPGVGYPAQPGVGYPTQPGVGYPTQPGAGYPTQPGAGYTTQPTLNPQTMGWPVNTGNMPYPGNTVPPFSGFPPTGQMQLPIPQNQFAGFGPTQPYTHPVYNTPLSPGQNDLEAQIATAFLSTQLTNMMRDPETRESMLYFVTELRSFLSNPNAIPFMRAMNHRAQDIMNTPSMYNQHGPQNLPHSTSTIVQVQDGANHLLDKVKAKGGKIMSIVKEMADVNGRMLEGATSDIPGVNSVVKLGTGLANAGVGFLDGFLSPWLNPNAHGGTTITTVSTPQTTFPTNQYQTPTSITVG